MGEPERQIISLLGEAIEHSSPEDRAAFLDKACAGDADRRARVEELLRAYQAAGNFLQGNRPPAEPVATVDEPIREGPGTVVGPYKLLEQIGEGGFGIVFMAEQQEPIRRKVALKVLKPGMDTRQVIARFEAERQALALMDHPNIAKVLDAGQAGSGRPYFVMDLVKGVPITEFCDQGQLTTNERLDLFSHVCQAVQHAHQKGIIHRDLKPSNVLVTLQDGRPLVKVIDFGIAKALGQQLTDKSLFTGFAQMIGTPLYMSPEQAAHSNVDVDTRSDIYSLGVLLYELLTGTTPFAKERFQETGYDEIRRIIREEDPPKPSTRISTLGQAASTVSANRRSDPRRLSQLFRGELDWIVMKCLEKDRNGRYETANGLARDIERYLHDEPVQACPPSAWYRFRKFVRRNKGPLLAAALVLLALVGGIVGTTWGMIRAEAARRDAVAAQLAEAERAEGERQAKQQALQRESEMRAVLDFVENKVFAAARPKDQEGGQGYDVKLADAVKAALPFVDKGFTGKPLIEAHLRMTMGASFWYLGDARTAIQQFQAARELYTALLGAEHENTLTSMRMLANSYRVAGRTQEALELHEETLHLMKAELGLDHPKTLASMSDLALSYATAGRTQEALKLNEEALQLMKATLGPEHQDTFMCMLNLANFYADAGRTVEALKLREDTLPLMKAKLGPDHPVTLMAMNNLVVSYVRAGRTEEAFKLSAEAFSLYKVKLGPDHPDTLRSMTSLAVSYRRVGRTQEALQLDEEAFQLYQAKLGPDHPETLFSMNNLAHAYLTVDQVSKSVAILQETLTLRERRVKAEPDNSREQSKLAQTHGQMGGAELARLDYAAAAEAYARSVAMFDKLDQAGALKHPFFRGLHSQFRQRLTLCRKAERAVKDLDFALQQPAAEVPGLLDLRLRHLLKDQKLPAAVESAAKIKELAGDKAEQLYGAACAYALCVKAAKQAKSPFAGAPDSGKLADEAMALLKQAVVKGYKNAAANMKGDMDMEALRDRADFQALLAELEAAKKN
jgi:serine/threonine protein kinase